MQPSTLTDAGLADGLAALADEARSAITWSRATCGRSAPGELAAAAVGARDPATSAAQSAVFKEGITAI